MTCEDCVHYAPCYSGGISIWKNIEQTEDDHCNYFKNKANVVEIVRCKDCKYYKTASYYCQKTKQGYCEFDDTVKQKQEYCSYGERKCDNGKQ